MRILYHKTYNHSEDRPRGGMTILYASSAKALAILGWNPNHPSIEEIVSTAWKWHQNHPDGYMTENLSQISPL